MRHTIETAPNVVIIEASRTRRGFANSWIAAIPVTAALVGFYFHAEVVAGDEGAQLKQAVESATAELRQSLQQEHDRAQQEHERAEALATELVKAWRHVGRLLSMRDGEAEQFSQAVDSATAVLRQSLQQEHDRAEALATELAKARRAVEQKPAAEEERPGVSLPAWANIDAFVHPAQTAVQPDVATENSKWAIKPGEPAPLPKRVEQEPRGGNRYGCQHFRTYDPASGTYMGYDGRRRSCP
jgi:ribosome-associated translation inhibitor RaiA